MTYDVDMTTETRTPLTRERVIQAAFGFADQHGVDELSMRKLGAELGVEAMSLYNHVTDKGDILDEMIDRVFLSMPPPDPRLDWKDALRQAGVGAMDAFTAHPWVINLLVSRASTRAGALAYMERILAILTHAGFSDADTHHAWQLLASHTIGYAIQQATNPGTDDSDPTAFETWLSRAGDIHPNITRLAPLIINCQFGREYEFGLEVIIDGLAGRLP
ncbi:MAG: TetR/AcrR family transcriptional regulator [Acidimicrobiia bacterium]|nr:TetR/AcrR family transcriptional regulator [Acidimicrobiia bacterium]